MHRLDPRVKIVCTLIFLISLVYDRTVFWAMLLATVFLVTVIQLSKVPLKYIVKGLKPVVILAAVHGGYESVS